jgi:hypothetical protein
MFRKSLVAALIGSSCGAAAAYWTPPPDTSADAPAVVKAAPARVDVAAAESPAPPAASQPGRDATTPPAALDVVPSGVVRRARELAQRPDVTALVTLREAVVRRAEETGHKDDPATAREIEAIDRYLFEARALRLRLDAAAFRKGT